MYIEVCSTPARYADPETLCISAMQITPVLDHEAGVPPRLKMIILPLNCTDVTRATSPAALDVAARLKHTVVDAWPVCEASPHTSPHLTYANNSGSGALVAVKIGIRMERNTTRTT